MHRGMLDRRVQIQRATMADDGYSSVEEWGDAGPVLWASRKDASDGERFQSQMSLSELMTRFVVRSDDFTRTISSDDRLVTEGRTFHVLGVKELGRNDWLEITASAQSDQ